MSEGGKCVFHNDIIKEMDKQDSLLSNCIKETLLNTTNVSKLSNEIEKLETKLKEAKLDYNTKIEAQRREFISFCKWLAAFLLTVFGLIFGIIQWVFG